ncbi:TPA: dihydrodipicolinate synthase family protein [Candidatus Poribacteria bacterium]|nr:dihydrodipicolinate synthase family protein [Candidatus Poribacteria bacterium]
MRIPEFLSDTIVPMFTPFRTNGAVDTEGINHLTEWLLEKPLKALFPLGGTGEWRGLSMEERKLVISTTLIAAKGQGPVMPGVHGNSLNETMELAKLAEDLGADAVTIVVPDFVDAKADALYHYYETVAISVQLPVVLYDTGNSTGNITPQLLGRLTQIENIVGIKDSSSDIGKLMQHVVEAEGQMAVLQGNETLYLPALSVGAVGAIGGGCNVYPEVIGDIHQAFDAGDHHRALYLQVKVCQLWKLVASGWPRSGKRALRSFGVQINETCRVNSGQGDENMEDNLKRLLE